MVVGIDRHGQRIGRPRHRMGRLQHLARVERMEVGIIVPQPMGRLVEDLLRSQPRPSRQRRSGSQPGRCPNSRARRSAARASKAGTRIFDHGDPSPYHSSGVRPVCCFILNQFLRQTILKMGRRRRKSVPFSQRNGTLTSALEPNRACAVARPTKQDSASGRSDSSSAIQSRKHESNGTRYCEVV